ncbi:hypothetical protein [Rhodopirellula baltica]
MFNVAAVTEYASTNAQKNAGLGKPSTISVGKSWHQSVVLFSKLNDGQAEKRGDEVTIHLTPNDALRLATELINQVNASIPHADHPHPKLKEKREEELKRQKERQEKERSERLEGMRARKKSRMRELKKNKRTT